jgi:predicted nucleic acid-binding protein
VTLPPAFWDSSALIPLCVIQPQTARARSLYGTFAIVAWWASQAEVWSGLTRLMRMRMISQRQFAQAKQLATALIDDWYVLHPSARIMADACLLLEKHPLSAADSLQLAAAIEASNRRPAKYTFITGDQRQADAARQIGFNVEFV